MDKLYYYDTIEELQKEIVSKAINADIEYSSNLTMISSFARLIRTIYIWAYFAIAAYVLIAYGVKWYFILTSAYLMVYVFFALVVGWVRYNHNLEFINAKKNLVENMSQSCKEFVEMDIPVWQRRQMIKGFGKLANLNIEYKDEVEQNKES